MAVVMSKQIVLPVMGKLLSDYAEGDIVYLNESGSPVAFYVAKHDYESGLNGAGRTLLVRKDCYDRRQWHTSNVNAYASSAIDTWLNSTYKGVLDAEVQKAIDATKFYYTVSRNNPTVTTLSRGVFLLSLTELGKDIDSANTEGSALPIADILRIAHFNGSATIWWTRTPRTDDLYRIITMNWSGVPNTSYTCSSNLESRPVFTLPSTTLFDPDTNEFKGVA